MQRLKVAILGGSSFLGREIIKQAKMADLQLVQVGRKSLLKYDFPEISFARSFDMVSLIDCDLIVNCLGAGIQPRHTDTSSDIFELNAFEPIRLINRLHDAGYKGKLITFGSYFEIGNAEVNYSFDEVEFVNVRNVLNSSYAQSKSVLTHFIDRSYEAFSFELAHLILPNVYGAGENDQRLFPYIKECVLHNKKMEFTSGVQIRQFLHVSDIASQVLKMLKLPFRGILNLGFETITVKDAIQEAIKVFSNKYEKAAEYEFAKVQKRDSEMLFLSLNDAFARKELDWKPEISLEQGLFAY